MTPQKPASPAASCQAAILPPRTIGNLSFRVLNEAGSYLLHPEPEMEFGTELGTGATSGTEFATALLHPEAGIPGEVELAGSSGGGEALLAAFEWIVPDEEAGAPRWLFVATVPRSDAAALASPILWELALVVLLIAGATCLIGWVWAHKVTHRVDELAKTARLISNGDRDAVAEEKGTDEVSDMARAFNTMTERLRDLLAKEQEARELLALMNVELKRSNAELENYARARRTTSRRRCGRSAHCPSGSRKTSTPCRMPCASTWRKCGARRGDCRNLSTACCNTRSSGGPAAGWRPSTRGRSWTRSLPRYRCLNRSP